MTLQLLLMDGAAEGLSKAPLIVFIGPIEIEEDTRHASIVPILPGNQLRCDNISTAFLRCRLVKSSTWEWECIKFVWAAG